MIREWRKIGLFPFATGRRLTSAPANMQCSARIGAKRVGGNARWIGKRVLRREAVEPIGRGARGHSDTPQL